MTRNCQNVERMPLPVRSYFSSGCELLPGIWVYHNREYTPAAVVLSLVDTGAVAEKLGGNAGQELLLQLLSPEEQRIFASYSYQKRRKEWLAGRIACKYAVAQLLSESVFPERFRALSVLPGPDGSPELLFSGEKVLKPAVSITHSGRYAAAMAGTVVSCGIDLQTVSERIRNVVPRFAAQEEIELLRAGTSNMDELERLTLLWSAKEAVKKSLLHDQPVIFQGMNLQRITAGTATSMWMNLAQDTRKTAKVTAYLLGEHALAFTVFGEDHA